MWWGQVSHPIPACASSSGMGTQLKISEMDWTKLPENKNITNNITWRSPFNLWGWIWPTEMQQRRKDKHSVCKLWQARFSLMSSLDDHWHQLPLREFFCWNITNLPKVILPVSWKQLMCFLEVIHAWEHTSIYLLNINVNDTWHSENFR